MHRLVPVAAAVCAVAVLAGCGDDKEDRAVATIPAAGTQATVQAPAATTTPAGRATTTTTTTTTAGSASTGSKRTSAPGSRTTTTSGSTTPPRARVQKAPPKELTPTQADATSEQQAATLAKAPDAERCPDALEDGAGVKDIVVVGTSCGRAKRVVYSGGHGANAGGFVCDIVAESFQGSPTILYSCTRSSDDAKIRYTAVG